MPRRPAPALQKSNQAVIFFARHLVDGGVSSPGNLRFRVSLFFQEMGDGLLEVLFLMVDAVSVLDLDLFLLDEVVVLP